MRKQPLGLAAKVKFLGTGCGSALNEQPATLCGRPARFVFKVLDLQVEDHYPPVPGGPMMGICLDHTRKLLIDMEPLLKQYKVILEPIDMNFLTVRCHNCQQTFKFVCEDPRVVKGTLSFCPGCGARAFAMQDPDSDYWVLLADSMDLNVELTKMLYDIWIKDPTGHPQFVTWAKEFADNG